MCPGSCRLHQAVSERRLVAMARQAMAPAAGAPPRQTLLSVARTMMRHARCVEASPLAPLCCMHSRFGTFIRLHFPFRVRRLRHTWLHVFVCGFCSHIMTVRWFSCWGLLRLCRTCMVCMSGRSTDTDTDLQHGGPTGCRWPDGRQRPADSGWLTAADSGWLTPARWTALQAAEQSRRHHGNAHRPRRLLQRRQAAASRRPLR